MMEGYQVRTMDNNQLVGFASVPEAPMWDYKHKILYVLLVKNVIEPISIKNSKIFFFSYEYCMSPISDNKTLKLIKPII